MKRTFSWAKGFVSGMLWFVILFEALICKVLWGMYKNEKKANEKSKSGGTGRHQWKEGTKTE